MALAAAAAGYNHVDQLGMVNVAVQLDKLRQHHTVGPALAEGRVRATGLFFDIATARVIHINSDGIDALGAAAAASIASVSQSTR